ncbi:MAG: 3-phosphoglycerate dehydrogenase [Eggerthellaceae bacterium]|nr:3-phosphoglycerate dehydrogenase [Eggerthellaceae bacterium]
MYKVKLFNKISEKGLDLFGPDFEYGEAIESPDVILVRSASLHDYDFGDNLLCVGRAGTGVNNIPLDKFSKAGIAVFNSPGANANAVKELVVLSLFMSSRDIAGGLNWISENKNDEEIDKSAEKVKKAFAGCEIKGKTIGIIGLGAIGSLVADSAFSLGMKVYGYDPYLSLMAALRLNPQIKLVHNLEDIFTKSDFISLHLPVTDSTKNMISAEQFVKFKDGASLINMARNGLVNDDDLVEALDGGKLHRYCTDFASKKLVNTKNTIVFPHLGASTEEAEENCATMVVEEIIDYILNGNVLNSVNLPNLDARQAETGKRLCVIHEADQQTVAQIHQNMSLRGRRSNGLISKQKGHFAYTVIDAEETISEEIASSIEGLDAVCKARII